MQALSRLLRPLDYARIKHPAKLKYDLWFPLLMSVTVVILLLLLPGRISIAGENGLIEIIAGLLQILTGFYIASLAAIATFRKEGMDNTMPGDPPTLKTTFRGKIKIDQLTRRRFLCLMFGYLALLSVFLYFLGKGSILVSGNMAMLIPGQYLSFAKWGYLTLYLFLFSNLLITTLLSLYYMVDRIHQTDGPLSMENDGI